MKARHILMTLAAGAGIAGAANAADDPRDDRHHASRPPGQPNNVYNLQTQIYVLPGATLTIEPGTVIASTTNIGGSLAVCKGAQIFVNGTQDEPGHHDLAGRRRDLDRRRPEDRHVACGLQRVGQPDRHGRRLHLGQQPRRSDDQRARRRMPTT